MQFSLRHMHRKRQGSAEKRRKNARGHQGTARRGREKTKVHNEAKHGSKEKKKRPCGPCFVLHIGREKEGKKGKRGTQARGNARRGGGRRGGGEKEKEGRRKRGPVGSTKGHFFAEYIIAKKTNTTTAGRSQTHNSSSRSKGLRHQYEAKKAQGRTSKQQAERIDNDLSLASVS